MALSRQERINLAGSITDARNEQYEKEGVEWDFDDGYRYLAQDASDDELLREEEKWCKQT